MSPEATVADWCWSVYALFGIDKSNDTQQADSDVRTTGHEVWGSEAAMAI